uniref:Transposase n=1 Tax=Steinernema glaseri TaxID=37863 RepID=A0A1I8A1Y7_9BILA
MTDRPRQTDCLDVSEAITLIQKFLDCQQLVVLRPIIAGQGRLLENTKQPHVCETIRFEAKTYSFLHIVCYDFYKVRLHKARVHFTKQASMRTPGN